MVVIRATSQEIQDVFGKDWNSNLISFSRIMGYSVELGDEIKIEMNPDRPDLFSLYSLYNSYRQYFGMKTSPGKISGSDRILKGRTDHRKWAAAFEVKFSSKDYSLIKDALNFTDKISDATGRSRKLFAFGIHDLDEISGDIEYLESSSVFEFETFDGIKGNIYELIKNHEKGKEYSKHLWDEGFLLLRDKKGIISVPPLFNSWRTRVKERSQNLLVDITAEDKKSLETALRLSVGYFINSGAEIRLMKSDNGDFDINELISRRKSKLTPVMIRKYIGIKSSEEDIEKNLRKMGYKKTSTSEFEIFTGRTDVMGSVDLMEDFLKGMGLDQIPESPLYSSFTGSQENTNLMSHNARKILLSMGLQEVVNFVLTSPKANQSGGLKILNAKSGEYSEARSDLLNGILEFFQRNKHNGFPQKIFEVGDIIENGNQSKAIAIGICSSNSSYSEMKGYMDSLISSTSVSNFKVLQDDIKHFIKGRSGVIEKNGKICGFIGELHPDKIKELGLELPISFLQVDLHSLSRS
ncbi:MAG: hypothetical protein ACYCR8_05390 [Cuniculiplasma sp.]